MAHAASSQPTAIVLAAGLGARLRSVHAEQPKGFVTIGDGPIIGRSLALLEAAGFAQIVLVAGWLESVYRDYLAQHYPSVRLALNPDYASTGSLSSLLIGAQGVTGEVLVVESDLVYESRAIAALLAAPGPSTLLASGLTGSGDEVWVYGQAGRLAQLSKQAWGGAPRIGELVGLTRIASAAVKALQAAGAQLPASAHYEDGLNAICNSHPVDVLKIDDLAWCEIDDPAHLERARTSVWPRIQARDGASMGARP